jgi:hypothetical protein
MLLLCSLLMIFNIFCLAKYLKPSCSFIGNLEMATSVSIINLSSHCLELL